MTSTFDSGVRIDEVAIGASAVRSKRRVVPLEEIRNVYAAHNRPRVSVHALSALLGCALGIPLLATFGSRGMSSAVTILGLSLVALAIFPSMFKLLVASDSYSVVVETAGGPQTLFTSADHQLVVRIVAEIADALTTVRSK